MGQIRPIKPCTALVNRLGVDPSGLTGVCRRHMGLRVGDLHQTPRSLALQKHPGSPWMHDQHRLLAASESVASRFSFVSGQLASLASLAAWTTRISI
jgi:hypothetical protein